MPTIKSEVVYTSNGITFVDGDMSASGVCIGEMPSSLNIWLDATSNNTILGTQAAVSGWCDKSGLSRHFYQTTDANKPSISIESGINGNQTMRFSVNDYLAITNRVLESASGEFIFVLNSPDVIQAHALISSCTSGTAGSYFVTYFSRGVGNREGWAASPGATTADFGLPFNNLNTIVRYMSSGNAFGIERNGEWSLPYAGTNNGVWFNDYATTNNLIVGGIHYNSAVSQFFEGVIGEMLYFENTNLIGEELKSIKLYLSRKWGIST